MSRCRGSLARTRARPTHGKALPAPSKANGGPYLGAALNENQAFEADEDLVNTQSDRLVAAIQEMKRPQRGQGGGNARTP